MKRYSVNDYNAHTGSDESAVNTGIAVIRKMRDISRIIESAAVSKTPLSDKMSAAMKSILFFLFENNGAAQHEIIEKTEIKAPTVSVSLKRLESLGYVVKTSDLVDLRLARVYLTDMGIELSEIYKRAISEAEKVCFKGMESDEIDLLYELISKVLQSLREV